MKNKLIQFQSTLPIRGATGSDGFPYVWDEISIHAPHTGSDTTCRGRCSATSNFNPRSPYGERQGSSVNIDQNEVISIHAPHTGSDGDRSR